MTIELLQKIYGLVNFEHHYQLRRKGLKSVMT